MPQQRLRNVRASYVYVHSRRKDKMGNEGKYELTLILDEKDNASDLKEAQRIIEGLKTHEKFQGKKPSKIVLRRGDDTEDRADDPSLGATKWTIGCRSKNKPTILEHKPGIGLVPLAEESGKPYSGCYGDALVDWYPFVNTSPEGTVTRGISAEILAFVFLKDGEHLGGKKEVNIEAAFADLAGEL
jgi:hypothetical protein